MYATVYGSDLGASDNYTISGDVTFASSALSAMTANRTGVLVGTTASPTPTITFNALQSVTPVVSSSAVTCVEWTGDWIDE